MDYSDVLAFVKENPVFFLATAEGPQPRVRALFSEFFDDGLIHFTTSTTKKVGRQVDGNPAVELCYCSPDFATMLRITCRLELVDDLDKKRVLLDRRDYLRAFTDRPDDPRFMLLRVTHGEARFWTIADNLKEDEIEAIEF